VAPLDELSRDTVNVQHAWLDDSMKRTSLMLSSRGDTPRGDTPRGRGSEATPEPPSAGEAASRAVAAAAVTPMTQLAADLEVSLTRHTRAKQADVAPLDELSRDAVNAQHAWLDGSMKQTSLMLSPRGDTPRSGGSEGKLQSTSSSAVPPRISTSENCYASKADDSLSRRAMLGFDGVPKLDSETAKIDSASREESVKAQQGWMAGLLMQMSPSFSPRNSKQSSIYGTESQVASTLGSPAAPPVGPPEPNSKMGAEEIAADKAAREEALRSQQGWLAGLLAAMSNRNSINSALTDSNRARSAADLGVADATQSEADKALRAEAVRAQQGWLASMLDGMQSFIGQSTENLAAEDVEGCSEHKTEEEKKADQKAKQEALRSQQGWLAGLLAGMSRDSLNAIPDGSSEHKTEEEKKADQKAKQEALRSQQGWLAGLLAGTSRDSLNVIPRVPERNISPSITPKPPSSLGVLRRDSSVLVGSPMRPGAGRSSCLSDDEDEVAARAWEIEQAELALRAAQREVDAHSGSGPIRVFPRVAQPVIPLRETPYTVKAQPVASRATARVPARVPAQVPSDLQEEDATEDQGAVFVPDMTVYSHLARKQGWRICPECSSGCDVCFPDGSGICGSCTTKFRWASAERLIPPQTLAELRREWRLKHTEMLAQLGPDEKMTLEMAASRYWMEATPDCSAKTKAALQLYRLAIALPLALSLPMLKKRAAEVRADAISASKAEAIPLTPSVARKARRLSSSAAAVVGRLSEANAEEEIKLGGIILTPTTHDGRKMVSDRIVVTNPRRTPKNSQPFEAP